MTTISTKVSIAYLGEQGFWAWPWAMCPLSGPDRRPHFAESAAAVLR